MNYAIIAAGEGSRLKKEGFGSVKPLVKVCGEFLIERLIRIFKNNGAESVSVIINEESAELKSFLNGRNWEVKINLIVKSTPSSLHSFWNIVQQTGITECCLTTVDTVFNEKDFKNYISQFKADESIDALMGVTEYIDDEKPLYIQTDDDGNILAFKDNKEPFQDNKAAFYKNEKPFQENKTPSYLTESPSYLTKVSAGIYCLRKKAIEKADECVNNNVSRMRNYQRSLVEGGLKVKSFLFSKVIDIDHIEDIEKAENLIKRFNTTVLCVKRFKDYSPNSENKDSEIISLVAENLKSEGFEVVCKDELNIDFNKEYYPYVISMARNPQVLENLKLWEEKGAKIVNPPLSCLNCRREEQIRILQSHNISIPKTVIVGTDEDLTALKNHSFLTNLYNGEKEWWIKRGDFQTVETIDVIKVSTVEKTAEVLANYKSRGIKTAVISENINGDTVKFYGVNRYISDKKNFSESESKKDFFYMTYPSEDKFGNKINTAKERNVFNENEFIRHCERAAMLLQSDIFGGDAVIDGYGNFYIIDMNDFPSFSSCKEAAAKSITEGFLNKCNI